MATVIRRRRRGLLMTSLLAAGSVLYTVFVFLPGQAELAKLRRKLHQQQQFVVASERLRSTIATTEHVLHEVSQYCHRWDCNRSLDQRMPEFLAQVTQAAAQHDVVLVRLTPGRSEPYQTFEQVSLTISVAGSWNGVLAFLHDLDAIPELHVVDRLEIERGTRDEQAMISTIDLVLFTGFSEKSS